MFWIICDVFCLAESVANILDIVKQALKTRITFNHPFAASNTWQESSTFGVDSQAALFLKKERAVVSAHCLSLPAQWIQTAPVVCMCFFHRNPLANGLPMASQCVQ